MTETNLEPVFHVRVGDEIGRDGLIEQLMRLRYEESETAHSPGEFSRRGGIVDVYPVSYRAPIRVLFSYDRIDSIRDFSVQDGKSLTAFEELFLLPATDTFLKQKSRLRERFESFEPLTELRDIRPGDYVVHLKYGIGTFLGSKIMKLSGVPKRHLAIEYADREILYIPADTQEPLERYIGAGSKKPKLTKLHSTQWARVKEKTRVAVEGIARGMLKLQALRTASDGFLFKPDDDWQRQFEDEFPFEETVDQEKAIQDVKRDMESKKPMDRLLCGDVGYGKTEIAFRAAFKAVMNGRQVAFLVPTTILAEQHYVVLTRRLKNFPVRVDLLSRYKSKAAQQKAVKALARGEVDIIIGTHRLLSKDVHIPKLGLVVIDEEQRFGVRHKERLKELRALVDVLTLTATPIPRTLYLSMLGVRDMSVINTPPKARLPIRTEILEFDDDRVRQAIQSELGRKGQVYFVHNRVESIERIYDHLRRLMPQVKFGVAHGQMKTDALERVMSDFIDGKIECLISTNIIESGLDIPNANTILINRSDAFGLADLYQLRGRVGRYPTARQAYAYFLIPRNWVMTRDAEKRLAAIERFSELGAGFKVAMEDLEIRGAGNILGEEQSGFIYQVGFDLYCRMLRRAIEEEKKER